MSRRIAGILLVIASVLPANAQGEPGLDQGRRLYEVHCAACHGLRGEGGKGTPLAQPTLPRATDRDSMVKVIRSGISGTEMPSSPLQADAILAVAAYVTSLGSRPLEQVPGNATNGAKLYATKGGCAQ